MSVIQLNIFDCDEKIRQKDDVFQQMMELTPEHSLFVKDMQIERTEKFYVVETSDFEEIFHDVAGCYEFVNRYL